MLRVTERISGGVMWANMFLLFSLSLIRVVTEWLLDVWIAYALYAGVAVMWLIPDRRFARLGATDGA